MKRKWLITGLLLTGALAGGVYAATHAGGAGGKAEIRQTPVSAVEIATVLNLQMYSFDVSLPPGEYSLHVWLEHWTRGAKEPHIQDLATMGGVEGKDGVLTVLLPTTEHPESYVGWDGTSTQTIPPNPIDLKRINGRCTLEPRKIVVGEDLPLAALVSNKTGVVEAGTEHVEQDHDETYYLRARFTAGRDPGHADGRWKDGKVVFSY